MHSNIGDDRNRRIARPKDAWVQIDVNTLRKRVAGAWTTDLYDSSTVRLIRNRGEVGKR